MSYSSIYDVLLKQVNTEKSTGQGAFSKYTFIVHKKAKKKTIKLVIKRVFDKDVKYVNIINIPSRTKVFKGRKGLRQGYKKAIVTLAQGETLDALE